MASDSEPENFFGPPEIAIPTPSKPPCKSTPNTLKTEKNHNKRLVQQLAAAKELSLQIFKIGRVVERWLMSSYSALHAIWS